MENRVDEMEEDVRRMSGAEFALSEKHEDALEENEMLRSTMMVMSTATQHPHPMTLSALPMGRREESRSRKRVDLTR